MGREPALDSTAEPAPRARRLGLTSAAALVIANMIGVGVFTTSGFALADLGRPELVLLAWVVGGVLALCGALCYGALARLYPESGGEYLFLSKTLHPMAGFLAGWVSLIAGFTAPIAAAGLGLQAYLHSSFGLSGRPEWIGTAAILSAGLMHGLRLREGVLLQNTAVAIKLVIIAGFVVLGLSHLPDLAAATPPAGSGGIGAFAVTLVWIAFSYSGWNAAVYIAGEVRNPERNLNRSLLLATALVTAAYLALNTVFVYSAPVAELAGKAEVGAVAAEALGGTTLRRVVSVLISLALFTSISSMVMVGPRVYAKMAEDGLFPRLFRGGSEVPGAAIALQVALALVVLWFTALADLLGYIGFTLGLSAAATVGGLVLLRMRHGPERVPIPGYPFIPALFIGVTLVMAGFLILREPAEALMGLLTMALGVPIYLGIRRRSRA